MVGEVPEEHRTDSLSAAFNNLAEQEELTARYRELCAHYGLRAQGAVCNRSSPKAHCSPIPRLWSSIRPSHQ